MKFLYYLNLLSFASVVCCYIFESVYGPLGQIPLALIQITSALILHQDYSIAKKKRKLIDIYFYSVISWIILFIIIGNLFSYAYIFTAFLFYIPMSIALYFVIITYQIKKSTS
ncbi:MAG: hypothetical protein JXR05_10140 [Flavobacteriaceae bacterium]